MDKPELVGLIRDRLKQLGLSAAEASQRAVGNEYLIANIGRERYGMPSFDKLQQLADVLGFELYFGPPREILPQPGEDLSDPDIVGVPISSASLSAGWGVENEREGAKKQFFFPRNFLRRVGVAPSNAAMAYVHGDSMAPTIQSGDLVLIDTSRREIEARRFPRGKARVPIYAMLDDGGARVKRIEWSIPSAVLVTSDNPEYDPEIVEAQNLDRMSIIGRVVWWGHMDGS